MAAGLAKVIDVAASLNDASSRKDSSHTEALLALTFSRNDHKASLLTLPGNCFMSRAVPTVEYASSRESLRLVLLPLFPSTDDKPRLSR